MTDFIDDILKNVKENYCGRKIIIWGSHSTAVKVRQRLEEENITFAFFIDSNIEQVDGEEVKKVDILEENLNKYYVVIPLGVHESIKSTLMKYGYKKNKDYYYFCDCAIIEKEDYYEDAHGNKIYGKRDKVNFVFLGFNSEIKIGKGVKIGKKNKFNIKSENRVDLGDYCYISSKFSCDDNAVIEIGDYSIVQPRFWLEKSACIKTSIKCEIRGNGDILIRKNATLCLDEGGRIVKFDLIEILKGGNIFVGQRVDIAKNAHILVCENACLFIDMDSSFEQNLTIVVSDNTKIIIGKDCMFSFDIVLLSDDGHSIFDVYEKKNLNSASNITRQRYINIGNHVWIGCRTIILYGTRIKDGSIIGAGSVVKRQISNNCIAVGIPAKVIKKDIAWSRENCHLDYIVKYDEKYVNRTLNN